MIRANVSLQVELSRDQYEVVPFREWEGLAGHMAGG